MFCASCGAGLGEGAVACPRCAAPVPEVFRPAKEERRPGPGARPGPPGTAGPKLPRWRRPLALALALALAGGAAAAWVAGRGLPGPLGGDRGPIVARLPDGASVTVPRASVAGTPEVTARRLEPSEFPPLPGWVHGTPILYEFSVDRPLRGPVVIRVPLPSGADLAVLAHFYEGTWRPVPFRREGRLAAAEVEELSIFGFLEAGYGVVEDWLQRHPVANWLLGGGTRPPDAPCPNPDPAVRVEVVGSRGTVSACAQRGRGETEIVIRNDRRFHLEVFPPAGSSARRRQGGIPDPLGGTGVILQPGGSVIWGTVLEGPLTFEARPTARALVFTNFRLLVSLAVAWAWDAPSEEILQAADRIAARMVGIVERSGRLVVELRDPFPDWGVVAREFAGLLSDPDMLEAFLELLTQEDVLDRAGVFATSEALRTLLQVPAVAGQIRTALDLVVGAVGGGVDALITFAPPGPVPASVTEENARVIFLRWGTLWAADLKGRDATPLSPLDQEAAFVGLAQRNGAPILYYLAGGPGRPALRARNLSSGETFELPARLPRGARYLYASSSPGGRYVALTFGDYERYSRVELLDLGTGDQRRVLTSACLYPGLNCPAYGPARWSPDGRLLLVNADYEDASGAVLADPFTAQRSEIGGFAGHGSWSPDGRAVCGYWADAEFGPESALIVGEAPDWAYRTLLERRAGEGLRAVWDCVWLDQSRIAFVSRDYDPQTHEPVDEAVSLYDLRSDEVEPVAHLGGEPVSELFAVPGLGVLAFNRWEGRPGLLQLSDGKVTSILQSGDQIVAITQVPIPLAPNTTADIWGPDAVVNRPHPDLYWCDVPDGCAEVLRRHGESARAIAYLRATDGFILIDFRELGRIDYGVQYLAPGANWAGFVLLNGDPSVIDGCAIAPEFDTLRRTDPRYRRLYGDLRERYEQVIPICDVGPGAGLEHSEPLADGGQRLVLRIPIMTCHACEVVGYLRWAVTFDTQGRLARTEVLEPGRGP